MPAAPAAATGDTTPAPPCTATNVIEALAWVTANMGGIAKRVRPRDKADDREFYAYRGIDEIAAVAQPLLGQAGVVIVPTEGTITSVEEITIRNNPWTDTLVTVVWTIYGPAGSTIEARTQGIGRDNSDKGYNKAMTQAYKNLLLRILCIGDPKDDADREEHQGNATDRRGAAGPQPPAETEERVYARSVFAAVRALAGTPAADAFAQWRTTNPGALDVNSLTDSPEWAMKVEAAATQAAAGTLVVAPPEAPDATDTPPDAPEVAAAPEDAPAAPPETTDANVVDLAPAVAEAAAFVEQARRRRT